MVFYCLIFAIRHSFSIRLHHKKRALLPSDYRNYRNFSIITCCL
nr:MAG TPA_asm: hypothetical protein [Caudoviricetes sp.]